jgi:hypothetical protein
VVTADIAQREAAFEEIFDWRFEQLLRVGYDRDQALAVSRRLDIDLHRAVDLIRSGCSCDLALLILL